MIEQDPALDPTQNQTPSNPPSGIDPGEPDPDNPKTGKLSGGDAFSRSLGSRRRRRPPEEEATEG